MKDGSHYYIAIGAHCWGKGKTPDAARRKARSYKPSWIRRTQYNVYEVTPLARNVYVSEYDGSLHWNGGQHAVRRLARGAL